MYIEYKRHAEGWAYFGGRINPGRNYLLFGTIAGVRVNDVSFIAPKGVPNDMAGKSLDDYTLFVTESAGSEEGFCTKESAERWVASGDSRMWDERRVTHPDWHTPSWLTADEFELAIANYLKVSGFQIGSLRLGAPNAPENQLQVSEGFDAQEAKWALDGISEYWAILAALRCFEAQSKSARVVFWFDN